MKVTIHVTCKLIDRFQGKRGSEAMIEAFEGACGACFPIPGVPRIRYQEDHSDWVTINPPLNPRFVTFWPTDPKGGPDDFGEGCLVHPILGDPAVISALAMSAITDTARPFTFDVDADIDGCE